MISPAFRQRTSSRVGTIDRCLPRCTTACIRSRLFRSRLVRAPCHSCLVQRRTRDSPSRAGERRAFRSRRRRRWCNTPSFERNKEIKANALTRSCVRVNEGLCVIQTKGFRELSHRARVGAVLQSPKAFAAGWYRGNAISPRCFFFADLSSA